MSEAQAAAQPKRGSPNSSMGRKRHAGGRRWPWLMAGSDIAAGHWMMISEVAVQVAKTEVLEHGRIRVHLDPKRWSDCPVQSVVVLGSSMVRMAGPGGQIKDGQEHGSG